MAPTPDDPTLAQAWISGTPPDQTVDFYIPRGNTGPMGPMGPMGPALTDAGQLMTGIIQEGRLPKRLSVSDLSATYALVGAPSGNALSKWTPNTAYGAGVQTISPAGDIVSAKVAFTSGSTYNATDWDASTQDTRVKVLETSASTQAARVKVLESSANLSSLVTNGTFRDGLTGWTNTGAWVVQTNTNSITSWARTMSGADGAFAQSIVIPTRLLGSPMRIKVLAMTTSVGTLLTKITTTAGTTSLNHTLTTSYVEYTLDVTIPSGQGTTPITLDIGRFTGTVYMTAIRLEEL